jgi:solute carrier family 40 (iron-regulated transporter), member 1
VAWQNAFELLSYASTIVFRSDEFKWPSLISVAAAASASATYTVFVYLRRIPTGYGYNDKVPGQQ